MHMHVHMKADLPFTEHMQLTAFPIKQTAFVSFAFVSFTEIKSLPVGGTLFKTSF